MARNRKYRGKYPTRIKAVGTGHFGRGVVVRLNDGSLWSVVPVTAQGRYCMPRLGVPLAAYQTAHYHIAAVIEEQR